MRRDYIDDYGPKWTEGFRRLIDQGAWFTKAAYPYLTTLTCAGPRDDLHRHLPSTHGIISNQWWDRETQRRIVHERPQAKRSRTGSAGRPGGSAPLLAVPDAGARPTARPVDGRRLVAEGRRGGDAVRTRGAATPCYGGRAAGGARRRPGRRAREVAAAVRRAECPSSSDFGRAGAGAQEVRLQIRDKGLGEKPPLSGRRNAARCSSARQADRLFLRSVAGEPLFGCLSRHGWRRPPIDGMKLGQGAGTDYLAMSFQRSISSGTTSVHAATRSRTCSGGSRGDRQAARTARQASRTRQVRARADGRPRRGHDSRALIADGPTPGGVKMAEMMALVDKRDQREVRRAADGSPSRRTASSISAGRVREDRRRSRAAGGGHRTRSKRGPASQKVYDGRAPASMAARPAIAYARPPRMATSLHGAAICSSCSNQTGSSSPKTRRSFRQCHHTRGPVSVPTACAARPLGRGSRPGAASRRSLPPTSRRPSLDSAV